MSEERPTRVNRAVQKYLNFPTEARYLENLREFVGEALAEGHVPEPTRRQLIHAVDEAVSTLIAYAQDANYLSELTVSLDIDDVRFKAVISDSRNHFDFTPGKETTRSGGTRFSRERRHKLAIFLLQRLVDEISYTFLKGFENRLELLKFLT